MGRKAELKHVQLPEDLFILLIRYHLMEDDSRAAEIQKGLQKKLDALVLHNLYGESKTALTEEKREKARQEYLNRKGIKGSFRW